MLSDLTGLMLSLMIRKAIVSRWLPIWHYTLNCILLTSSRSVKPTGARSTIWGLRIAFLSKRATLTPRRMRQPTCSVAEHVDNTYPWASSLQGRLTGIESCEVSDSQKPSANNAFYNRYSFAVSTASSPPSSTRFISKPRIRRGAYEDYQFP